MTKKGKYAELEDREWIEPIRKGFKFRCCDCGLVHTINFRYKKRKIGVQVKHNNRATAQSRRWGNYNKI